MREALIIDAGCTGVITDLNEKLTPLKKEKKDVSVQRQFISRALFLSHDCFDV